MAQNFTTDEEDEIFQCAICLENMLNRRPKALPCLHTFCADCIKNLILPLSNIVRCPICRKESEVIGGEENLPDNFYLKNLAKHETTVTNTDMQMTGLESTLRTGRRVIPVIHDIQQWLNYSEFKKQQIKELFFIMAGVILVLAVMNLAAVRFVMLLVFIHAIYRLAVLIVEGPNNNN